MIGNEVEWTAAVTDVMHAMSAAQAPFSHEFMGRRPEGQSVAMVKNGDTPKALFNGLNEQKSPPTRLSWTAVAGYTC